MRRKEEIVRIGYIDARAGSVIYDVLGSGLASMKSMSEDAVALARRPCLGDALMRALTFVVETLSRFPVRWAGRSSCFVL